MIQYIAIKSQLYITRREQTLQDLQYSVHYELLLTLRAKIAFFSAVLHCLLWSQFEAVLFITTCRRSERSEFIQCHASGKLPCNRRETFAWNTFVKQNNVFIYLRNS